MGLQAAAFVADDDAGPLLWRAMAAQQDDLRLVLRRRGAELQLGEALVTGFGELLAAPVQRRALCDGDWEPYAHALEAQADGCAESGIPLPAWFELLEASHGALQSRLGPQPRVLDAAAGWLQFTLSRFGAAYVRRRAQLAPSGEPDSAIFQLLFANNASGMLIYRLEDRSDAGSFRLLCANAAAARASHPRIFEHVGKCLNETSPYLLETEVPRHYLNAVLLGKSAQWVISTGAAALAAKTYTARCFPLMGDYVAVTFEDITERREMELRIERHVADLERSNRELDDFAYVASHDLKGPLHDVKTLATWIQEDVGEGLPEPTLRHIQTMVARVCRMERLLDDLLAYSRAGRASTSANDFGVRELFDEVLELTGVPEGFDIRVAADVPPVRTPKEPLAQVLRNLIGNAIKHHDRSRGSIELSAVDQGDRIRIVVSDDGPGIPPAFHGQVFRLFQTLRPRDELEGSGIGLAIVKKVVESHGGTVTIESVSRGTAIHFTWPKEWVS